MKRISRDERGVAMVFIATTVVAMLVASAFALDLGMGYTSRRQMQNAADAAAMAGTRALMKVRIGNGLFLDPTASVWTAVRDTAQANGADTLQTSQCKVIRRDGSEIANCSPVTGWLTDAVTNPSGGGPHGVKVVPAVTKATAFGQVLDQDSVTARAKSSALMRPLVTSRGSPFVICGKSSAGGWDILAADNSIKPTARTNPLLHLPRYNLQESQARDCGAGADFKGKSFDDSTPISIGDWVKVSNGNGNDHGVYDTVAGATPCVPPNFTDCDIVVPIADVGRSGLEMHVVNFAVFHITGDGTGNPKYRGELLFPGVPVTRGEGGTGACTFGAACVIKLTN
jgi:hypothetical protein